MSNSLKEIVKFVQLKMGWNLDQVAKSIGYSRVHLTRLMKEKKKSDVEDLILKKHSALFQNETLPGGGTLVIKTEKPSEKDFLLEKATVKALYQQVAKLSAKVFDRPFADCLTELEQSTILILKDLQESR